MTNTIEERIRRLEDLQEISDLVLRYAHHAARGEGREIAALFTPDGSISMRREAQGRADIESYILANNKPFSQIPFVQNILVNIDGDEATGSVLMHLPWIGTGPGTCGIYQDHFLRENDRWWFRHRKWTRFMQPVAD